jgi:hypothetical protein
MQKHISQLNREARNPDTMSSDWRVQTEEHFRQYCPEMIATLVKDGGIALPLDVKAAI